MKKKAVSILLSAALAAGMTAGNSINRKMSSGHTYQKKTRQLMVLAAYGQYMNTSGKRIQKNISQKKNIPAG